MSSIHLTEGQMNTIQLVNIYRKEKEDLLLIETIAMSTQAVKMSFAKETNNNTFLCQIWIANKVETSNRNELLLIFV